MADTLTDDGMWGKWVKNGSTHLVVYLGGKGSLPSGHPVTDAAMENAVGQDADFLFLGQLNADSDCPDDAQELIDCGRGSEIEYSVWRNVRLVKLSFIWDFAYKTITYVGFSLGALDFGLSVQKRKNDSYDMGFEPAPTLGSWKRMISIASGGEFGEEAADIEIKSTGDHNCPYKKLDDELLESTSEFEVLRDMSEITRNTLLVQPGRKSSAPLWSHATIGSEIINCGILYIRPT